MPTLVILLYFQMWMPSSYSMWLVGGQKLFSTTSNQPGVEWVKGFPTKYFFNTMYCTMYIAMLNIKPSTYVCQKILSPQDRKRISDSWQCVQPRRPRGSGGDSVDKMLLRVLVHLSLPHTQERLNFANKNQTFGANFCVNSGRLIPSSSSCAFCVENDMILNKRWADEASE